MSHERSSGKFRGVLILVALVGVVVLFMAAFRAGAPAEISITSDLPGIGKRTMIRVRVAEPKRGLTDWRVEFVQGERVELLGAHSHEPLAPWQLWGERTREDTIEVEVGNETLERIEEGQATIRVLADRASSWLRYPGPALGELTLPVKLRPPALEVLSSATYVSQGGCEAVVYRVGESSIGDGVQVGDDLFFPGNPLPGGEPGRRFVLFGVPFDFDDPAQIRLVAHDDVENRAAASFVDKFFRKPFRQDKIRVSDSFMSRVVPAIMSQTPALRDRGNLLENYLMINNELRAENTRTIAELAQRSAPEFLWNRRFIQMPNAKVMSDFADRRTYVYEGREVDQQDHLGFDLASTRMAQIPSANDGVVVLARYLGIYGNAVIVDHGYGLMSLYGHLSSLAVEEGQTVERGQSLGRSGETGLAGGDHLHFSMLIHGVSVNPREWWDSHWIADRLVLKLGSALPFEN